MVHSIAFAPQDALGGNFLETGWDSVATAVEVSAYSLKALAVACLPLMEERGGSIVGLDFDAQTAWPAYDWMGVAKAALESTSRYVARDLGPRGIRCNLVAAGPVKTMAAKSIPGFETFREVWNTRSPIGWDLSDPEPHGPGCRRAALGLVPPDDGRDRARRRRGARHRGMRPSAAAPPRPAAAMAGEGRRGVRRRGVPMRRSPRRAGGSGCPWPPCRSR